VPLKGSEPSKIRTSKLTGLYTYSVRQINTIMKLPYEKQQTVEKLYELFSNQEYKPTAYYCLPF
jgi:succinyl-CoA synthetase beta subunit